jgi:EmrB/QacA subfamily drug resistance transporter
MEASRVHHRRWAILAVLCVSLLVVGLDNTILNVALPTLVRDLHASASQLQWIVDAFTIVYAGLVITAGSLGDRFGRKGALFVGLAIFGLGSGLSAFSGSADELIAFRCLMGVGGALVLPSTLSILTNVFVSPGERGKAIGIWSGTSGLGIAIGPIVGGWLLSHFWWGSVFLVNVPVCALGLVAIALMVPSSKDPAARRSDPTGTVLSIAGLGLLLWGIIEAPVYGWTSATALVGIAGGVVVLAAFVLWERHSDHPMFRMDFFSNPRFSAASVSVALVFFALFGAMFLLTQYLQSVLGFSPLGAGLRIAPVAVMLAAGSPAAAVLDRKIGTKATVGTGLGVVAVGMVLLSMLSVSSSYAYILSAILVLGLGMGLTLAPSTDAIMGSLPKEEAGVGSAMNGTTIQVGGAIGVAVLGSLLDQRYRSRLGAGLAAQHVAPSIAHTVEASLGAALVVAKKIGGVSGHALAAGARTSFVSGVNLADLIGFGVAVLGMVVALVFLPSRARPLEAVEADRATTGGEARPSSSSAASGR